MRAIILGCGTSTGVPLITGEWGKCDPDNPKNRRSRASLLVETETTRLLVDTTPDFRNQLLAAKVNRLDAVFFSHAHADHLHGIDDLRGINAKIKGPIPAYANEKTLDAIRLRFGYVFEKLKSEYSYVYKPWVIPHVLAEPVTIGDITVTGFRQHHGFSETLGLRFRSSTGDLAYSTDVVGLPPDSFVALKGVPLWIVDCLREKPHPTHAHLGRVLEWIEEIKPQRTILTHMNFEADYDTLRKKCPPGVEPAYDGMILDCL